MGSLKPVPVLDKCKSVASSDGAEAEMLGVASPPTPLRDGLLYSPKRSVVVESSCSVLHEGDSDGKSA